MADFIIKVIVDPTRAQRGAKQVEGSLNRVGNAADRTRQLIARAFAFAGITVGIRQLVGLADTFTNVQNRIRTVTDGTAQLGAVTDELFAISNRTRSSFEATAEVFTRTALATRELGISQQQTLQFTESLNQAVILSGASAQEANAGLIQLSQGLGSGALRGDELRSVLEQLPVVADVIAKSLGVTRGELRELGTQGRITADIILEAFKESREELARRFAKTIPTISQSVTILRNNFIRLIGSLATTSGASAGLSRLIILLADNLDLVARIAATAGIALGVSFAVRGVGVATAAIKALTLAIAANPIGALIIAVTIAVSALIAFSDQIRLGEGRLANLRDLGKATFEALSEALKPFIALFKIGFKFIADFAKDIFGDISFSVEGLLVVVARVIDNIVGFFRGASKAVVIAFENIPAALEAIFVRAFNNVLRLGTDFVNTINSQTSGVFRALGFKVQGDIKAIQLQVSEEAVIIGQSMDQAIADGITAQNAAETALTGILARAEEIAQERLEARLAAKAAANAAKRELEAAGPRRAGIPADTVLFRQILEDLKREAELLRLSGREREILQGIFQAEKKLKRDLALGERELLVAQLELNQALVEEREILDEIRGPQDQFARQIVTLNKLLKEGAITTEEFTRKQQELRLAVLDTGTDLASGLERGLIRLSQQFNDFATLAEDTLVNAFKSAEDAFLDFVTTGKFEFSSLVNGILVDITRLAIRQSITGPLANLLGLGAGGGGGLGSLLGSLFGVATGGGGSPGIPGLDHGGSIDVGGKGGVDQNTLSINNRPVARVSRGERVTVTPNNGSEGRPVQVNIRIVTPDANSFRRSQDQIARQVGMGIDRALKRNN